MLSNFEVSSSIYTLDTLRLNGPFHPREQSLNLKHVKYDQLLHDLYT